VLPTSAAGRDSGPLALSGAAGLEENGRNILQTLSRTVGYAGVILFDSSGPLASDSQGEKLRAPIFTRGLGLADLSETASKELGLAAIKARVPYAGGAEILDRDLRPQSIRDALDLLEARAVAQGSAVGVLSPTPVGYQEIQTWIQTLRRKNIVLAPLSGQMTSVPDKEAAP
ncbi:MAG TPA: divergent polysaccharide deacetylase family protein, partial [Alphaproteobacteria bacterium]|nr:divergent polysaccharide deacetylase family protein [Alphaproteobacteria bacterium]